MNLRLCFTEKKTVLMFKEKALVTSVLITKDLRFCQTMNYNVMSFF